MKPMSEPNETLQMLARCGERAQDARIINPNFLARIERNVEMIEKIYDDCVMEHAVQHGMLKRAIDKADQTGPRLLLELGEPQNHAEAQKIRLREGINRKFTLN